MSKKLKLKKILKWAAAVVCLVFIAAFLFLMFYGVPRPAAITTEGVPRVPWKPLFKGAGAIKRMMTSTSFAAWYPPERRMLIYAASRFTPQLHVLLEPGGQPEKLMSLRDMPLQVRFNPDPNKNYFVFSMDVDGDERYQLYRFNLSDKTYHRFTDGSSRNYSGCFDASGNLFAYTSTGGDRRETYVYIVDLADAESKRMIYQGQGVWWLGRWSPAGNEILLWEGISPGEHRLHVLDVTTGEIKDCLAEETGKVRHVSAVWSKDGKSIYFVSDKESEFLTLRRLDLSTGNVRPLTAHIAWDVEQCIISPDGNYLALKINEDGFSTLHLLDTKTEEIWKVSDLSDGLIEGIAFHPRHNEVAFTHICPEGIASVYSYNMDSKELTRWTDTDSEDTDTLPPPRVIRYSTFDKVDGKPRMIPAVVFDGAIGLEGPGPVVIDMHGGPWAQSYPIGSPFHDIVRKEGITIITPNFRGSTGYGKTFATLDNGYLREDSVRDIGALLDWISTQPGLDTQRVAVTGASYGGYMVLASLIHHGDRLRCGMDFFGISSLVTWLENSEGSFRDYRRAEIGDERDPEMRAFLKSISPVNHAGKIRVPLFVVHGKNDMRVLISEARQIVDQVRAQGGEVWYIEAANEGHGIMKPQNGLYVGAAAFAFLREHLLEKD
jgi:dipeptidyl aminopeptidase/acylaminoacyl peptidase